MEKGIKFTNNQDVEYQIYFPSFLINRCGDCDDPNIQKPIIRVDSRLSERRNMQVVVEEIFHAFFWDKTETQARKFSNTITKALFEEGYRLDQGARKRTQVNKKTPSSVAQKRAAKKRVDKKKKKN